MADVQSKHNHLIINNGGTQANNYVFRPLYRPSSGCTSYYTTIVNNKIVVF